MERTPDRYRSWIPRGRGRFQPFRPTDMDNCELWLDAGRGITLSGSNVTGWADQSGNGNDVAQDGSNGIPDYVSSSAEINGRACVHFTQASSEYLMNASFVLAHPITTFVVFERDSLATNGRYVFALGNTEDPCIAINGDDKDEARAQTPFVAGLIYGAAADDAWSVYTALYNGAASKIWTNNSLIDSGDIGAGAAIKIFLGSYDGNSTADHYFDGSIAEFIIYSRVLSESERSYVERYLMGKYGITPS